MEILQIIFRIILFTLGFYFLLEYIIACSLPTSTCFIILGICMVAVLAIFVFTHAKNVKICHGCSRVRFSTIQEKITNMFK